MRLFSFLHLRVSESNKHLLNNLFAVIPATPQSLRWLDSLHEANLFISIAIDFFLPSRCRDGGFPRPRHANFFRRDARLVLHHCGMPTQAGNQDETRLSATSMLWLPTTNPTISFEIRLTFPICSLTVSLNLGVLRFSAKQTFLFFIFSGRRGADMRFRKDAHRANAVFDDVFHCCFFRRAFSSAEACALELSWKSGLSNEAEAASASCEK